ncbi:TPA: hypothetical protein ACNIEA_003730 [Citrobacter koseri]|uniref:hypothetical protein n=1 Tax=Citrobacter TaxID=544 RepID=UPI00079C5BF9|nr:MULTISPECIES: hypothetical protein [Citrobacter]KXA01954.1 hypothetical protein HMPREF3220_01306 [Citrobacter koseri]KXA05454.1 hypothetical protein HMPREF3207_00803 [Citrobacter koseri]KXB46877.1 hypothetical protein HMPREF0208_00494 [Citrobacter koseri]MBL4563465.1 hypothetical protein [Citrobacter koseri]MDM2946768.1 hypothetical protein [Citrobacter sp. CK207]
MPDGAALISAYHDNNTLQIIAILLHSFHNHTRMIASAAGAGIIEALFGKRVSI